MDTTLDEFGYPVRVDRVFSSQNLRLIWLSILFTLSVHDDWADTLGYHLSTT